MLRLSRRRWIGIAAVVLAVLVSVIAADRNGWLIYRGSDLSRYDGRRVTVVHVIDGDTVDVDVPDGDKPTTRIRFWGIDAPEIAKPWRHEPGEPGADEATDFVRERLLNQKVTLRLEAHRPRDKFGRLLAFLVLEKGKSINLEMVELGYAPADLRWPHHAMEAFAQAEQQAKEKQLGIWAE